jgi:hypothetical protein
MILSIKQDKGIALIVTILLMSLILLLSIYFLNFSLTEGRIAHSQSYGAKTYYLAEAGIAEMVWRLKNDATYETNFETDPSWQETFVRNNPFGPESGSYTVTITNSDLAYGEIVSTGAINIGDGTNQRVVKTQVYRAMGSGDIDDNGGYADGNIDISLSNVDFYNGSSHSNLNFIVNGASTVNIDTDLNVVNNFVKSDLSEVNVAGVTYAANVDPPGPAEEIEMPAVDFNSADANSYINIADVIYTQAEFETLMENNQSLTLNDPITYVEGDIDARGGQTLIINGLLVVERDFDIGRKECWQGVTRCGNSSLTINHTEEQASGILAKRKVEFNSWSGNMNINGIVYATDQLNILNFPLGYNFNVIGGLLSRKLTITSSWQTINITYDSETISSSLSATEFSPIITVEHWEEEY